MIVEEDVTAIAEVDPGGSRIVREPRDGSDLRIVGHPVGAMTPVVEVFQSAGSSPGEIYPSIVDVPKPGCWHFDLWWAGHAAAVELSYT